MTKYEYEYVFTPTIWLPNEEWSASEEIFLQKCSEDDI